MLSDLYFDETVTRTISVDIRYVLFIIDKFGGNERIINELTIVK
jgi:Peptidase S46